MTTKKTLPTFDEIKEKYGELCAVREAKKILGLAYSKPLMDMIESGELDGMYFEKDVHFIRTDAIGNRNKYVFLKQKLIEKKKMPYLSTLDDLEAKLAKQGKTLVGAGLVQKKLQLTGKQFKVLLDEGRFDSIKFDAGVDYQPTGTRQKMAFILEDLDSSRDLPTLDKLERVNGKTCGMTKAAKILGISQQALPILLEDGLLDEYCYRRDVDFVLSGHRRGDIAFDIRKLSQLRDGKWLRLNEIAKKLAVPYGSLLTKTRYAPDILNPAKVHPSEKVFLWDYAKFCELLPTAEETLRKNSAQGSFTRISTDVAINHYNYLPIWLQERVDQYFIRRTSKASTITFNGFPVNNKRLSKKAVKEVYQPMLCRFLFRIICVLCGITQFYRIVDGVSILNPPDSEWSKWDTEMFRFDNLSLETFEQAVSDMTNKTFNTYYQTVKPFFYFLLMKLDEEQKLKRIKERWTPEKRANEEMALNDIKSHVVYILNSFTNIEVTAPDEAKKVFLTREEFVRIWNALNQQKGLKYALMFAVATLLGLRKEEITAVAIEDFWIDKTTGLLSTDTDGYGRLFFPQQKSKQDKGHSHKVYGTLIPPILVEWINLYLSTYLYPKCSFANHRKYIKEFEGKNSGKIVYAEGHGYLFRENDYHPNANVSKSNLAKLLPGIRSELAFLSPLQQKHLSFHDTRHTLNEWIETTPNLPASLMGLRDEAADLQMRHDMERSTQDTGKKSYRFKTAKFIIKEDEYKAIIEVALNFPWDLKLLRMWEIKQGLKDRQETLVNISAKETIEIEAPEVVFLEELEKARIELTLEQQQEVAALIQKAERYLDQKDPSNDVDFVAWLQSRKTVREALEWTKEAKAQNRMDIWEAITCLAEATKDVA